jgi:hypothetical protein
MRMHGVGRALAGPRRRSLSCRFQESCSADLATLYLSIKRSQALAGPRLRSLQ